MWQRNLRQFLLRTSVPQCPIKHRLKYHKISIAFSLSLKQIIKQAHLLPFVDVEEYLRQLGVEYLLSLLGRILSTYLLYS